jgi:GT2 family glycosyltransferase
MHHKKFATTSHFMGHKVRENGDMSPSNNPSISVLMPIFSPDLDHLTEAINSVISQTFASWELILINDEPSNEELKLYLQTIETLDPRLRVVEAPKNLGISLASQMGLESAAGIWIALLDQDDLLEKSALSQSFLTAISNSDVAVVYSDADKIDLQGRYVDRYEKPIWSPERLRGNMYIAHLTFFNRNLAMQVGGFRPGFDGSQDHDLILRLSETGKAIIHIPHVLYHWRISETSTAFDPNSKPYAAIAGVKAVQEHLNRIGISGQVESVKNFAGFYEIKRTPTAHQKVSIIIPTRGSSAVIRGRNLVLVNHLVESIAQRPQHSLAEIVLVVDRDSDQDYVKRIKEITNVHVEVVEFDPPFNFSAKVNLGINSANSDLVLLLNDDIELISTNWLDPLTAIMNQEDVAAVGPLLFFEDETIQHGGHYYAKGGATHRYLGEKFKPGYFGDLLIEHEVSGLTGAFIMFRKNDWERVGGWSEDLPNNFNDVDFCLKLRSLGKRMVFSPRVEAFHFESKTREANVQQWEVVELLERWGHELGSNREPYGPGGEPFGFASGRKLTWHPVDVFYRVRKLLGNVYYGRRPYYKIHH